MHLVGFVARLDGAGIPGPPREITAHAQHGAPGRVVLGKASLAGFHHAAAHIGEFFAKRVEHVVCADRNIGFAVGKERQRRQGLAGVTLLVQRLAKQAEPLVDIEAALGEQRHTLGSLQQVFQRVEVEAVGVCERAEIVGRVAILTIDQGQAALRGAEVAVRRRRTALGDDGVVRAGN